MNFTQIFHGMVGRDFIKAFNDIKVLRFIVKILS